MSDRRTVAIMQPYFAPYAGYYRLLAAADLFVIYDCVQFPRRGWVHRNRLPARNGEADWLTLPLAHAPYDAKISALRFAPDAPARMKERLACFPSMEALNDDACSFLHAAPFENFFVDYLEQQLRAAHALLGLNCDFLRSSALDIDPALRAQDRILAILERVGGTDYINAPGGRALYDETNFRERGVALHFLPDYDGPLWSMAHRLACEPIDALRAEILGQTPPLFQAAKSFATISGVAASS